MTNPDFAPSTDPTSFEYGRSEQDIKERHEARAAGVNPDQPIFVDFWGKTKLERWHFPGQEELPDSHKQYIEFKGMNEGARARYQKATNRGVVIEKKTQDMRMGVDAAGDRRALFEESVTDWRFAREGQLLQFKMHLFREWLETANPEHVDGLEKAIRKANPWMISEMSSDQIREEIEALEDQWKEAKKREEADETFGSKPTS